MPNNDFDFRPYLSDLLPDGQQILEGFGSLAYVPQQCGGMVDGGHPDPVFLHPLAVLPGDAVFGINDPLGCNTAQADDDPGLDQCHLIAKISDAIILLRFHGVPVPGRAALDDVGNIAVFLAVQVNDGKHIIQQFSGGTYKGDPSYTTFTSFDFFIRGVVDFAQRITGE